MTSPHIDCLHHENHTSRIERNEKDIQDIFKIVEKLQVSIFKIVGSLTAVGLTGNYLIQTFGK